jgi:hypothetical protein
MEEEQQATEATQAVENSPESTDATAEREQRIADYVTQSLEVGDPFEANVGVVNADLMLLALRYRQVLGEALEQPPENLAELAEIMPSVDSYVRLVKQVDRISQLAMKLKAANASP